MGIVLSKSEKKSFISFLALYLSSSIFLIVSIGYLYYTSMANTNLEIQKDKMRNYALSLASKVIYAHMRGEVFVYENSSSYQVSLLSKEKNLLYGNHFEIDNLNKGFHIQDKVLYLVDRTSQLHLGVDYVVIKYDKYFQSLKELQIKVLGSTVLSIIFISFVGYILGKIFLRPIANERKKIDKFIQDTTHELNTPVTALIMSIYSIKFEDEKLANRIKISANRISHIYNDLCYLLQNNVQKEEIDETINVKEIIQEQLILFEMFANSKHINLNSNLYDLFVYMDKESVTRIVVNLLSNAIKYSKPHTTIQLSLTNNKLIVKDEGIGMEKEKIEYYLSRYARANGEESGFGIGLDIVSDICKKYNILFSINSTFGVGTIIRLEF